MVRKGRYQKGRCPPARAEDSLWLLTCKAESSPGEIDHNPGESRGECEEEGEGVESLQRS